MLLPKLSEFKFSNKTVLVRGDLDVPLRELKTQSANWRTKLKTFEVEDDTRLKACLPTIKYLLKQNCKVILMGHLGRPKGKVTEGLELAPVAEKISQLLRPEIKTKASKIQLKIQNIPIYLISENLWLLENLRFYPGEEENDLGFVNILSTFGDFYVNEAFSASHRKHASIVGLPKLLSHCAGLHFTEEVENLIKVLDNPRRPLVFVLGGAKPETKLKFIDQFSQKADWVLVGGRLPVDYSKESQEKVLVATLTEDKLDINSDSIKKFSEIINLAKTLVWNGPLGKYEEKRHESGTRKVAEAIVGIKGIKMVGGGDTIAALNKYGLLSKMDFVSLGGGAMLEFLAKGTLPGIQAISNQSSAIRQKYTED